MIERRWMRSGGVAAAVRRVAGRHALAWLLMAMVALAVTGCAPRASAHNSPRARGDLGFRTQALFNEHYAKHGREFGGVSQDEYLRIAQTLRDAATGGKVLEFTRDDGVTTRFDRGSGTFIAFNRDGTIRTCFRPRDGERYFKRQAMRNVRAR